MPIFIKSKGRKYYLYKPYTYYEEAIKEAHRYKKKGKKWIITINEGKYLLWLTNVIILK